MKGDARDRSESARELRVVSVEGDVEAVQSDVLTREAESKALIFQIARQVAHDIRSPLCALKILASRIEAFGEIDRSLVRSLIERIEGIADDLLSTSHTIQSLNREVPARKELVSRSGPCIRRGEILRLLEETVAMKQIEHEGRGTISLQIEASEPSDRFRGSLRSLGRVLSNLINNSFEALPEGDGRVLVHVEFNECHVLVEVRDNGSGIPASALSKVGRDGFTTKPGKGCGCGLWHARRTIEEWGGGLKIYSVEGRGTTVSFTLPRSRPTGAKLQSD